MFRVTWPSQIGKGYTHTLQARDEHDKKQWLNAIQSGIEQARLRKRRSGDGTADEVLEPHKLADNDSDSPLDDSLEKENMICLDDVEATMMSSMSPPVRRRSIVRDVKSPRSAASPVLGGATGHNTRRSLTRSQSSCILTTPNLTGQCIPFADDSPTEEKITPTRPRSTPTRRKSTNVTPTAVVTPLHYTPTSSALITDVPPITPTAMVTPTDKVTDKLTPSVMVTPTFNLTPLITPSDQATSVSPSDGQTPRTPVTSSSPSTTPSSGTRRSRRSSTI